MQGRDEGEAKLKERKMRTRIRMDCAMKARTKKGGVTSTPINIRPAPIKASDFFFPKYKRMCAFRKSE